MKNQKWQLQDAKNKFSRVAEEAVQYGPQIVTKHGQDAVVVLSMEEYQRLLNPRTKMGKFLASSPLAGSDLQVERDTSPGRDAEL